MICYLISTGVGVWGLNHPVMWGWAIVNFVWWIGIGHAGTLISAILFLLRQRWRTSINRAAEAMTIFAVMCAGIFPVIHIGRIWYGVVALSPAQLEQHLAAVPLPADVGRVRRLDLLHRVRCSSGTSAWFPTWRSCATGPRPRPASSSTACSRWAGPARTGTGAITRRPISSWPACRRRWCCRCTASSRWTSRCRSFPAGTRPSSRPTLSPARFISGFGMVLTLIDPVAEAAASWRRSSPCGTST